MKHHHGIRRVAPRLRMAMAGAILGATALAFGSIAQAADYPNRPIKVIVPFGAGGGTDVLTRIWADAVGKRLNERILVENVSGAAGSIGTKAGIKSEPDGYNLLMGVASTMAINPATRDDLGYTYKDVQPIAIIGFSPWLMVVSSKLPIHSVKELIDYGKAHPGKLTYPSWSGTGELGRKLFVLRTGIDITSVPYKGGVAAITDLVAGRASMVMMDVSQAWPHIVSGELRPIAMTSTQRTAVLPDVPSIVEAGVKNFDVTSFVVLFAPHGVPQDIIEKLNVETRAALNDNEIKKKFEKLGAEVKDWDVQQTTDFVAEKANSWASVVKEIKAKGL